MRVRVLLVVVSAIVLVAAAPAGARAASFDSHAPDAAPPHWLPPEPWVYNHWLPYDEGRLYRLLHITRSQLWLQLRNDHHNVAQLAARHGWPRASRLAAALVAPWRGRVSAGRVAVLRERALRTLTQGHLAQHLFFHSLHQFAIASAAPTIFGVEDVAFRDLRRTDELSPLTIARLHGHGPAWVEAQSIGVLVGRMRAGVSGHAMTARQGRLLLRRQLSQLPRWLDQDRYNGPPKTHRGKLVAKPRDYANNPALSADGSHLAYEAYRQALPKALTLGEIAVALRDLAASDVALAFRSPPPGPGGTQPISAYNPSVSADGRLVAFETAAGNQNFAKRYGRIDVTLADMATGTARRIDAIHRGATYSQSAYNPRLAADGSALAYTAVRDERLVLLVEDLRTGVTTRVAAGRPADPGGRYEDVYEPSISGDGRVAAYTRVLGTIAGPARSEIVVHDRGSGRDTVIRDGAADSEPVLSGDGRFVAYLAAARDGSRTALVRRELAGGARRVVDAGAAAVPVDPSVSTDGSRIAYTAMTGAGGRILVWDAATGKSRQAARGDGSSGDPSISGDGHTVAFASTATDLDPARRDGVRAIYVCDLAAGTTHLASGALPGS